MIDQLWAGATWTDILAWLPELGRAFLINLHLLALSMLIGLPGGFVLALMSRSDRRWLCWPAIALVELGRGVPVLVLIQFIYFGLPQLGTTPGAFAAAVAAFAASTACYTSEIIRSGLDAVPRGQKEAAAAMNMSMVDEMRFVILPQALRISAPALLGFAILMLQCTALCFTISLPEILAAAYEIGSASFTYFPVLILTALFFVAVCTPASLYVGWLERDKSK